MSDTTRPGILPAQAIETLIATGAIASQTPFDADQVQPASLDLRLSDTCWRVRASFLPGSRKVEDRIADVVMHTLDLSGGEVLEKGCVYIARLQERLTLPPGLIARANPKSSTGRVDVFVRLLTDQGASFDDVAEGYDGPLYLEIAPQTFSILVRPGTRLNQLRLKAGEPPKLETRSVGVDLQAGDIVGFRGRRHAGVIDLDHIDGHDPRDFWEPLSLRRGELLLDPGEFYILASSDDVEIPVDQAADSEVFRPDPVERRQPAAEHMVAPGEQPRAIERPQVRDILHHAQAARIPPRIGTDPARVLRVDVAAGLALDQPLLHLGQRGDELA